MSHLQLLDFIIIVLFFIITIAITLYYSKKAGKNRESFFLSQRNLPWYVAGTAMVATTFAADTPLAVTELVAKNGIAGNWLWWNLAIGGILTVFFFAKLWRRAGIMTDVEFTEMRYSGKTAAVLRGFRALYLGFFMNAVVMGWVNKAMEKIFLVTFPGYNAFFLVAVCALIISIYASFSGLLGTARTDSFQFVFAMAGTILLAYFVVQIPEISSLVNLKNKLPAHVFDFFPKIGAVTMKDAVGGVMALSVGAFMAHIGVQWWSSWYPGAEPGGGGYIAQRMMSCKNENHSMFATLWFNIAHYTVRPWPWIIVGLAALVILQRSPSAEVLRIENPSLFGQAQELHENKDRLNHPEIKANKQLLDFYEKYENTVDPGIMYPKLMFRYLPPGILGLLIAAFLAAYMSTISSQLNWGTSYLINDFYKRFIKKEADEKHYVLISRIAIIFMTIISLLVARYALTTISGAWEFIINASAGIGLVLILRWFWWRINAWSEIAAMITPLIIYPVARFKFGLESPLTLYPIVFGTTIVWLMVTFITKPADKSLLLNFYKKVHPGGIGWKKIARELPDVKSDSGFGRLFVNWIAGVVVIYSFLFGLGNFVFSEFGIAAVWFSATIMATIIIYYNLKKINYQKVPE